MIESITGNEDAGKWNCAVRFCLSLDMQLILGMTELGTEFYASYIIYNITSMTVRSGK